MRKIYFNFYVQLLGNLCCGKATHTLQHLVTVLCFRGQLVDGLVLLFDSLLLDLQCQRHNLHVRQLAAFTIVSGDIAPCLSDLRKDFRGHPVLEHFCL